MLARFFIGHPRFAAVISIVLALGGTLAMVSLPIEQYPQVTPPQVQVSAFYPGASAEVLASTVAAPLEEEINGVDNMIYMQSTCDDQGGYELTVTFEVGTDLNISQVKVQNRVAQATPKLPVEVIQQGLNITTQSPSILGLLSFVSSNEAHDRFFLSDFVHGQVEDVLKRVPGVGGAMVFGPEYSMRVWLDADRMNSLGLSSNDVVQAIQAQNVQASLGSVGAVPGNDAQQVMYVLQAEGRLNDPEQFKNIIVRANEQGGLVRLQDVGSVELGGNAYAPQGFYNGADSTIIMLSQTPGTNAIEAMDAVRAALEDMRSVFPEGVDYHFVYDATSFVRISIQEIAFTLLVTFILVVLVCYLFLQDWRATLVPTVAIPVSLLATFAVLLVLGYSINLLTLFALVLAIGVVVDDAIVVVERVIHLMEEEKLNKRAATLKAMEQVTSAIIASTLVLTAIFVPIGFVPGVTGRIYRQFAVAISTSVLFSAVVALTLSPVLCAVFLRIPKHRRHGPLAWFSSNLERARNGYIALATYLANRKLLTMMCLIAVIAAAAFLALLTPTGFLPDEDQGFVFGAVQLPEGATLARTKAVLDQIVPDILNTPGVEQVVSVAGFGMIGGRGENVGFLGIALAPWSERETPDTQVGAIVQSLQGRLAALPEAQVNLFTPPPILGLGDSGGMDIRLQALGETDPSALGAVLQGIMLQLNQAPEIMFAFSGYTANTPHLYVDVDREKAQSMNVPIATLFSTLQNYLGSRYVNDVNFGNQVNQVYVQADSDDRRSLDDIRRLYVKSLTGDMVSVDSLVNVRTVAAPRTVERFNLFRSASITAMTPPGVSSGAGLEAVERIARDTLSDDYRVAWSGMSYQEKRAGSQGGTLFGLALLFGYLFLVAQYESWSIPIPVILSLSVAMLGALIGLHALHLPLSMYAQLGLIILIGIASKNAILIIEFAKEGRAAGKPIIEAASTAMWERFRPVLMTAFTFILGTLPLVFATGAGSASRRAIGTTVFSGMTIATVFGIVMIPALYVVFQTLRERVKGTLHTPATTQEEVSDEARP
jgi:HAE1 family hydrophobic/amphiphilic exporter-1/multidrug efflux pump